MHMPEVADIIEDREISDLYEDFGEHGLIGSIVLAGDGVCDGVELGQN